MNEVMERERVTVATLAATTDRQGETLSEAERQFQGWWTFGGGFLLIHQARAELQYGACVLESKRSRRGGNDVGVHAHLC